MATHKHDGADDVFEGERLQPTSEMNITPMIDVLLVLLVILMAALPLNQRGLDVELPEAPTDVALEPPPDTQIVLEYSSDRQLSVNKQGVDLQDLETRLRSIFKSRRDKTMFIIAARSLRYGDIVNVIDAAKGAGVERVGIVTAGMRRAARVTRPT